MNYENNTWSDKMPDQSLSVYEPNLRLFFEIMYDRQMIWKKRFIDKLPRPWTDDPIFQNNKFTNVYRELDHNSQWEIKNILLDDGLSLKNLIWKLMFFRFFNNPPTFTWEPDNSNSTGNSVNTTIQTKTNTPVCKPLFGDDGMPFTETQTTVNVNKCDFTSKKWRNGIPDYEEYNADEYLAYLKYLRTLDINPFTSAYLISSKGDRDTYYTKTVLPNIHKKLDELMKLAATAATPEKFIKFLSDQPGIGGFMAHEFYTDFTYIPRYTNRTFMKFGPNDFTNVGPGSGLGCRLIYPNLKTDKERATGFYKLVDCAEEWLTRIAEERNAPMPYLGWNKDTREYYIEEKCNITVHQIEMWLCEFSKYWKMQIGEGKQRSKFEPRLTDLIVK